ncbi:hypothetical protein FOXYSP1_19567 [Fusarium oxysporum f. sp. phaseoli]
MSFHYLNQHNKTCPLTHKSHILVTFPPIM